MTIERLEGRQQFAAVLPTGFTETLIASGIVSPTSKAELPDGRLLVSQRTGAVREIKAGVLRSTPVLSLNVDTLGERGLLAVEADPNFAANHFIYVHYFKKGSNSGQISRFTMTGDSVVAGSEKVLLTLSPQSATNGSHSGGAMHFGKDGKLYITTGDNQNGANAQDLSVTHGKLLRINPDGTIPADNPYLAASGTEASIYASGLRNPFTFGVNKSTGVIYLNDVGEKAYEEIDVARSGANFGWPGSEGPTDAAGIDGPVYSYAPPAPGVGVSITGGAFYAGVTQQFPASFAGKYLFGDYVQGTISVFDPVAKTATPFASGLGKMIDLDVRADGTLLATTYDGIVHAITYAKPQPNSAKLSGFTFNDTDRSGTYTTGDGLASGKTVFLDTDNDGVLDTGEKSAVTDSSGNFAFTGLAAGTYRVRRVFPKGYQASTPLINLTLADGQVVSGLSIGSVTTQVTPPPPPPPPTGTASVAGYVVNDTNANGKWSSGEFGIASRSVFIDADNDGVLDTDEASVLTDSGGAFKFTGLAAGTYKVRQVVPAGWLQTSPANGFGLNVVLTDGQAKTGQTFLTKLA